MKDLVPSRVFLHPECISALHLPRGLVTLVSPAITSGGALVGFPSRARSHGVLDVILRSRVPERTPVDPVDASAARRSFGRFPGLTSDGGTFAAAFGGFVLLHVTVWTMLPMVFTRSLPVDAVEGVIWGQGWQLGYTHPPLQAWLLGAAGWLGGYQRWAVYLLGQGLVATAAWAVWQLARSIVTPRGALVSVLTLEGLLFFNLMTPNVFPDLVELPLWALAIGAFYRSLRCSTPRDWALLGLWLAGAAYAKYVGAVLAAVMIGFMLLEPQARRCWRTSGPYLSAGLCLLLLAPHLWWASEHGFTSFHRFSDSAIPTAGVVADRARAVAAFAGGELAFVALAGVLLLVLRGLRPGEKQLRLAGAPTLFDRRFVAVMALGPILLTLVAAAASGLEFRPHWGFAMWSLIGLFGVIFVVPRAYEGAYRRFVCAWAATFVFVALLYVGANTVGPYAQAHLAAWHVLKRYQREGAYPTGQLAAELTRRWHERVGAPLAFVIGSKWLAGHVGFLSEDHPLVLRDGSTAKCPWIDADELGRRGAAIVWDPGEDAKRGGRYRGWLADSTPQQRFPAMEVQPPIVLPWTTGAALPPLRISWGILYPADRPGHPPRPPAETGDARDE